MKTYREIFPQLYPFHCWHTPTAAAVGATPEQFLQQLDGPTHLYIPGADSTRCRAMVTLLHGNEPSGLFGLFELVREHIQPAVDIHCFIISVAAAKTPPGFYFRQLPGQRDINRCFKPPFDTNPQSQLAQGLLNTLTQLAPEAVIDVHNTSGSGPSFGVTTFMDDKHDALVSLFSQRLIVTDLPLGALMEISEAHIPTVTIECGGAQDTGAHRVAYRGLKEYMTRNNVLHPPTADFAPEIFYHPKRLELTESATVTYNPLPQRDAELTLMPDVEHLNFGYVDEHTELGFVNGTLEQVLRVKTAKGYHHPQEYFQTQSGVLRPAQRLKLFMVTSNPAIAKSDCLFYFVAEEYTQL